MNTDKGFFDLPKQKIPVGVSSCLLGERVRYDGGHKRNETIINILGKDFDLQGYCPELAAGMGVPRPPIRLQLDEAGVKALGVEDSSLDLSDDLQRCAEHKKVWHSSLCGYIFKAGSPSCGMQGVKVYRSDKAQPESVGVGLYANILMENFPALPVEDEARLGDPILRGSFVSRVRLMFRWKQMLVEGLSKQSLKNFHSQCEVSLMSRGKNECRALGRLLHSDQDIEKTADQYIERVMALYKASVYKVTAAEI